MENEKIKKEYKELTLVINNSRERLNELRTICKHEKTYEGDYSWRIGSIRKAEICEYCGELIRYI